jgi:hypothetical protein
MHYWRCLVMAAWGKFFYSAESLRSLDRWVSGFEILLCLLIIFFRSYWPLWMGASVVFAGWSGYALYGYFLELPCSCMGALLDIPTGLSLALDLLFFAMGLSLSYLLGARFRWIYFGFLCALMAALVGYAVANWVYTPILTQIVG